MDLDKIKTYYNFNADLWRYMRERLESMQDTDKWWDSTYKLATELLKKHEQVLDESYIRQKIDTELRELLRLCKAKRGGVDG